ncbi:MAG: xanthine dehydrogenase family protein molybdopterin-binding subunit [Gemmatimonadota bacterium]|nr:MAG: xanthine dehydrogenase family protein molybdopterin-binding subunit [Gemmatimonadota bacterium]
MKYYLEWPEPDPTNLPPPAQDIEPWGETRVVGKPLPRVDAYERVSGTALYTLDMALPDMLHGAILRCPHAHARVTRLDTGRAQAMPGVRAVITAATPGAAIPWYFRGQGPTSMLFDEHCRYAGDEVAAVAAETPHQAILAARAIDVEYEVLPFVQDDAVALTPEAPAIHEGGNILGQETSGRGDVEAGFAGADVVLEQTYHTPCEIHTPMETFVTIARWDGNRLTVWDSNQGVFGIQANLARALRLPLTSVRVICNYMGGGFGSKLGLSKYTVIAALLARTTARPVKIALTREESFICVGNRAANTIKLKAGVKRDGTLTALDAVFLGSGGAYPAGATSTYLVQALYLCPNVRVEDNEVYTNAGPSRAFRAPGMPNCAWALEQMMDALATEIDMDPVEFRLKNIATFLQINDTPYTSIGLRECLSDGAKAFGWSEARARPRGRGHVRRGVGMAAGMWAYPGDPRATVIVKLFADGSVNLNMGASDIGTGTKTVMAMVVAEELGVPLDRIQIEHADTGTTQNAPSSGGSQTVLVSAPAVRAAAIEVKRQLLELAAAQLERPVEQLVFQDGEIMPADAPDQAVALADLRGLRGRQVIVGVGRRHPHPEGKIALPFAAQFAEVEVNILTGEVRVLRLVAAHDSGRVMNKLTYENQVFGGMAMGIGLGLTEERILDSRQTGKVVNANWHDYKIPTAKDVPIDQTCVPIDPHDTECNTTGAKGLGEPAHIPTAAAIANAVYHATGVRVTDAPITRGRMLSALAERRGE